MSKNPGHTYGVANELIRIGQLYIFLSMITKENTVEKDVEKDNQYVKRAIEYIQNNYHIPIKVADIADYVCINRSYLYSLFQESTKMSQQQFLSRLQRCLLHSIVKRKKKRKIR